MGREPKLPLMQPFLGLEDRRRQRRPGDTASRPSSARPSSTPQSPTRHSPPCRTPSRPRLGRRSRGRGSTARAPLLALLLAGCLPWARRSAGPPPGLQGNREDPALSGDGRLLASVVERGGRATLLLQEQPSGRLVPLPQLGRLQPHRSPSLSWNGRYVALLGQEGDRSRPLLLDRLTGQLRRLLTPSGLEPQRLSLSPDGQRLALQLLQQGRSQVQVFDLSGLLEPDRPPGQLQRGGGAR
jgi:hypothetical protein